MVHSRKCESSGSQSESRAPHSIAAPSLLPLSPPAVCIARDGCATVHAFQPTLCMCGRGARLTADVMGSVRMVRVSLSPARRFKSQGRPSSLLFTLFACAEIQRRGGNQSGSSVRRASRSLNTQRSQYQDCLPRTKAGTLRQYDDVVACPNKPAYGA